MNTYDFRVHPLAALFPDLPAEEFKKLKEDIQTHRQQEPIMLSPDGLVLLDGRHRLRACKELGIQPRIERLDISFISEADFIWSKNVFRRHLTDDQRVTIGLKWADAIREAAKQRMKDGGKGLVNPPNPVHTREAIAKQAGVSTHKVRQVETVAKHRPELLPKVESGEMKLKDAAKLATAEPQQSKPPKSSYKPPDTAVNMAMKEAEKLVVAARELFVEPSQYEAYNYAAAHRLEEFANRLRAWSTGGRYPAKRVQAVGVQVGAS